MRCSSTTGKTKKIKMFAYFLWNVAALWKAATIALENESLLRKINYVNQINL